MKIALPVDENNNIDSHFGHCKAFSVVTVSDNKEIEECIRIPSPEGCGCKSNIASVLQDYGVSLMLAGNMGDGAVNVLQRHGIKAIRGCSGEMIQVVNDYLNGKITDSGIVCHHHEHECKNHTK